MELKASPLLQCQGYAHTMAITAGRFLTPVLLHLNNAEGGQLARHFYLPWV